mmetsp:Transcript_27472/g.33652  ORF Transcript_27472/g.33652 Transcript_27472/m.33652 type:complete len:568 (+) Transcript_27472:185-1888(+)
MVEDGQSGVAFSGNEIEHGTFPLSNDEGTGGDADGGYDNIGRLTRKGGRNLYLKIGIFFFVIAMLTTFIAILDGMGMFQGKKRDDSTDTVAASSSSISTASMSIPTMTPIESSTSGGAPAPESASSQSCSTMDGVEHCVTLASDCDSPGCECRYSLQVMGQMPFPTDCLSCEVCSTNNGQVDRTYSLDCSNIMGSPAGIFGCDAASLDTTTTTKEEVIVEDMQNNEEDNEDENTIPSLVCNSDADCEQNVCARETGDVTSQSLICCPSGESISDPSGTYSFCTEMIAGSICYADVMCASFDCVDEVCAASEISEGSTEGDDDGLSVGEECDDDNECQGKLACAKAAGKRLAPKVCCWNGVIEIASVIYCADMPTGLPCSDDDMCASGVCVGTTIFNRECRDGILDVEETCENDQHCQNGKCGLAEVAILAPRICCPSGEHVPWGTDDYCTEMGEGIKCRLEEMCARGLTCSRLNKCKATVGGGIFGGGSGDGILGGILGGGDNDGDGILAGILGGDGNNDGDSILAGILGGDGDNNGDGILGSILGENGILGGGSGGLGGILKPGGN